MKLTSILICPSCSVPTPSDWNHRTVAAEATRDMVQRLSGIAVDSKDAAAAVKAELNG